MKNIKYYRKDSAHGWTVSTTENNAKNLKQEEISVCHRLWQNNYILKYSSFSRLKNSGLVLPTILYLEEIVDTESSYNFTRRNRTIVYNADRWSSFRDLEAAINKWMNDVEAKWESREKKKMISKEKTKKLQK